MPYVMGLMSGTSLDGCDAAIVQMDDEIRLRFYKAFDMPVALRARILDACSLERSNIALTCSLNAEIGCWMARVAKDACRLAGIPLENLYCIGSHGQTVYHIPFKERDLIPSTLQLGEPAIIAYETGVPVVSSFRAKDMAAGGQGAPLVPYPEYLLYRGERARALQNIGGIGNVTVLPRDPSLEDVFAFDTGPGNMISDALMLHFYGKPYDENGDTALRGTPRDDILRAWMALPFITLPPPKSTGRELYGAQFVKEQLAKYPNTLPQDFVATAARYTALTIYDSYCRFVFPRTPIDDIILSGGGSHNAAVIYHLKQLLPEYSILIQEDVGWDSDAKEAVAFALLAWETMNRRPGNIPSATGARCPVVLGSITWPE